MAGAMLDHLEPVHNENRELALTVNFELQLKNPEQVRIFCMLKYIVFFVV
jgi:hypothetical protein